MGLGIAASAMIAMARSITKTETLDQANAFCTDAELLAVLNVELAELDDVIVENQDEDYSRSIWPISITAGVSVYPLPTDDYKVKSVDIQWTSDIRRSAHRFTEAERNRFRTSLAIGWSHFGRVWFRLIGSNIEFIPVPATAVTAYVNYEPSFTPLTDLTAAYDSRNGWHMAAVWGLAAYIAGADKDDEGAARYLALKERQIARVRSLAASRVEGEPPRIQSTRNNSEDDF